MQTNTSILKIYNLFLTSFFVYQVTLLLVAQDVIVVFASYALKDASINDSNATPVEDIGEWIILRRSMSWGDASAECDQEYYRLAALDTKDKAVALVAKIKEKSTPYTADYDKLYKAVEYGMDRRYWIGLQDQIEEGNWAWTHNGGPLKYDFWYPGQPDHGSASSNANDTRKHKDKEHCVVLWNPGYYVGDTHTFNDESCRNLHYAICEKTRPAGPSAPAADSPPAAGVPSTAPINKTG